MFQALLTAAGREEHSQSLNAARKEADGKQILEEFGLTLEQKKAIDAIVVSNLRVGVTVNTHIAGRSHVR